MRLITGVIRRPARAAAFVLGELLRVEAVALTELGKITQNAGRLIQETLSTDRVPDVPDPLAPTSSAAQEHGRAPVSVPRVFPESPEPNVTAINDYQRASSPGTVSAGAAGERRSAGSSATPDAASRSGEPETPAASGDRQAPSPPTPPPTSAVPSAAPERPPAKADHVDEEAVLVSESADADAEDGAGANVRVQEPWNGYRSMRAREIVDHLAAVPDEVLTLVILYEAKPGRSRPTVIKAAERELSRRAA